MGEKTRVIPRKYIEIELRGEKYKIFSMSAADLKALPKTIERLLATIILQASALAQADWGVRPANPKRGRLPVEVNMPPQATMDLLRQFLEGIIEDPLAILEVVSGLPHKFFDTNDRENCLSLDEIQEVAKAVIEVNGLDFLWAKVKGWWMNAQKNAMRRPLSPYAVSLDTGQMPPASPRSNENSPTTKSPGFITRLFGRTKKSSSPKPN
ncbi:MAG: hypothetical protein N2Z74_09135 [Syntrophales bacterium]|nr:hypothetical protein [Syntrophales bacterium]